MIKNVVIGVLAVLLFGHYTIKDFIDFLSSKEATITSLSTLIGAVGGIILLWKTFTELKKSKNEIKDYLTKSKSELILKKREELPKLLIEFQNLNVQLNDLKNTIETLNNFNDWQYCRYKNIDNYFKNIDEIEDMNNFQKMDFYRLSGLNNKFIDHSLKYNNLSKESNKLKNKLDLIIFGYGSSDLNKLYTAFHKNLKEINSLNLQLIAEKIIKPEDKNLSKEEILEKTKKYKSEIKDEEEEITFKNLIIFNLMILQARYDISGENSNIYWLMNTYPFYENNKNKVKTTVDTIVKELELENRFLAIK